MCRWNTDSLAMYWVSISWWKADPEHKWPAVQSSPHVVSSIATHSPRSNWKRRHSWYGNQEEIQSRSDTSLEYASDVGRQESRGHRPRCRVWRRPHWQSHTEENRSVAANEYGWPSTRVTVKWHRRTAKGQTWFEIHTDEPGKVRKEPEVHRNFAPNFRSNLEKILFTLLDNDVDILSSVSDRVVFCFLNSTSTVP